jgi:DNA-binding NarL/FixJ family response regulator
MRETPAVPEGQGSPPVRVLIADDDRLFAQSMRAQFADLDEVDVVGIANDGSEAVALVDQLRPDVVLMDVAMPALDGIDATRRIRDLAPETSVVLITGKDGQADSRAYEAGAAAYLKKSDVVAVVDVIFAIARLGGALCVAALV